MKSNHKKQVFLRVISAPEPPPLRILAVAFGVDERTLRIWRAEQRKAADAVRGDTEHCLKILERA